MSAHRRMTLWMLTGVAVALLCRTDTAQADVSRRTGQLILTRLELQLGSGSTPAVRAGAARTLGAMGRAARRCLPALERALSGDRATEVRLAAARALGTLRQRRSVAALGRALLKDRQPMVLMPQASHAFAAWQIADHWGNRRFARAAPRAEVLAAVLLHDAGWTEFDRRPSVDPHGRIHTFDRPYGEQL